MRENSQPSTSDPDPGPIEVFAADLPGGLAFGFTTPEGERVCIVNHGASKSASNGHESAHKAFWKLLAP